MRLNPQRPKHQLVFESLEQEILEGKYAPGQKLPSEAALVTRFGVSRITAGRAVRDLQRAGLVERRSGSGTFVSARADPKKRDLTFGLLIPNLGETEIFEPVCRGLASSRRAQGHALIWGNAGEVSGGVEQQALQLCRQYISRRVSGVFFAPVELSPTAGEVNLEILAAFEAARIPVVLLDRDALPYPRRSAHDLVGIDNRRAGYLIAEHLAKHGSRRIAFVAYEHSAPTVAARIAGYREACFVHGTATNPRLVTHLAAGAESQLHRLIKDQRPDAIVCANDRTAGRVMHELLALGLRIPQDLRVAGIDDVAYARLLPVPLTTVHQPARQIGEVALSVMLERIQRPDTPVRDVLLGCEVVIRQSCGSTHGA